MSSDPRIAISKAEGLARAGKKEEAMALAKELVDQYPGEMEVWSLRGYLHALSRDYAKAVADLGRAIGINSAEPVLFYDRGRYSLALGDDLAAVSDFTTGLELCEFHDNDYYRESLHFLRAEALLRLGRKREAIVDLAQVRGDFKTWTYRLRTKADLLAELSKLPNE